MGILNDFIGGSYPAGLHKVSGSNRVPVLGGQCFPPPIIPRESSFGPSCWFDFKTNKSHEPMVGMFSNVVYNILAATIAKFVQMGTITRSL